MDQLPQGCRVTTRRQFTGLIIHSPGYPGTHIIGLWTMKGWIHHGQSCHFLLIMKNEQNWGVLRRILEVFLKTVASFLIKFGTKLFQIFNRLTTISSIILKQVKWFLIKINWNQMVFVYMNGVYKIKWSLYDCHNCEIKDLKSVQISLLKDRLLRT